jgi:hypothetical protein
MLGMNLHPTDTIRACSSSTSVNAALLCYWYGMKASRLVLAITMVSVAGCGANQLEQFRKDGLTRAAFDMGCPREQLSVAPLNPEATDWNLHAGGRSESPAAGRRPPT